MSSKKLGLSGAISEMHPSNVIQNYPLDVVSDHQKSDFMCFVTVGTTKETSSVHLNGLKSVFAGSLDKANANYTSYRHFIRG